MLTLSAKSGVIWDVVPALEAAQPVIAKAFADLKKVAIVTSARDSKHSEHTAHTTGRAIDLRITTLFSDISFAAGLRAWYERLYTFAHDLALLLEAAGLDGVFYVVLERDHLHVEWAPKGEAPNIKGWAKERRVYATAEVRGYLDGKAAA